jgi:ribonuclease VapC
LIALDSSALVAIAVYEPDAGPLADAVANNRCLIGTPTLFELHMVLRDRAGDIGLRFIEELLKRRNVEKVDFAEAHFRLSAFAFNRYGRGQGHPARLNFGDCMAYAIAKAHGVPLLYKGDDFAHTDIASALP